MPLSRSLRRRAGLAIAGLALIGAAGAPLLVAWLREEDVSRHHIAPGGASDTSGLALPPGQPRGSLLLGASGRERADVETAMAVAADRRSARVLEILDLLKTADPGAQSRLDQELRALLAVSRTGLSEEARSRLLGALVTLPPDLGARVGSALGAMTGDVPMAVEMVTALGEEALHPRTRTAMLEALTRMRVPDVVPALLERMGAGGGAETALPRVVVAIGGPQVVPGLLALLVRPIDAELRRAIVAAFVTLGEPGPYDAAVRALERADAAARGSLLDILSAGAAPRHAVLVREWAREDPDEEVRGRALRLLGRFPDEPSVALLAEVAERADMAGDDALQGLRSIGDAGAIRRLAAGWERLGPRVRGAVLAAAAELDDPPADLRERAVEALHDAEEAVRAQAVRVLARPAREDAVQPLVELVRNSGSSAERVLGIEYLLQIGTPAAAKAVRTLVDLLPESHRDRYRQRAAALLVAAER